MRIWLCLCMCLCSALAQADTGMVLGPPVDHPGIGSKLIFPVFINNYGKKTASVPLPENLVCRLSTADASIQVIAKLISPSGESAVDVDGGGFVKALYAIQLPLSLHGTTSLVVPALNQIGIIFTIAAETPSFAPPELPGSAASASQWDLDVFTNIYQPYAKNISFYKPIYFLVGTDPAESKFQISIKYRVFNPEETLTQKYPWVQGIHLAYTQTSFWNLAESSAPFEDVSYKPEIFFRTRNIDAGLKWLKGFFVQTGYQHESNGRSGDNSRGTNFAYIEPSFIMMNEKNLTGLKVTPRLQLYATESNGLNDYRGYFDLQLTFGKATGLIMDSHFYAAAKGASFQLDLTYPLHRLFDYNVDLYFQVEYVNALAESLIRYTERTQAVRLGIAIVR